MKQIEIDFVKSHGRENNTESQMNYESNLEKFNNNCRIIFEQLLTGRRLTGLEVVKLGIIEYRKRFDDLKKLYNIPVKDGYVDGKRYKTWWLESGFINQYLNA